MLPHPPRALIFDMDGLMLDSERIYRLAWFAAIEEFGQAMDDEIFHRFLGRVASDSHRLLREIYGADFDAVRFWDRAMELSYTRFAPAGMPWKPGLADLLAWLEARAFPRAIATSTLRPLALRFLNGLERRFDVLTTGDEVTRGKPDPEIFLLAASRLQIAPADCLVLEDSAAGVRAARAAGMSVIMIPDLVQPTSEIRALAHAVLPSLTDVQALLQSPH
ncbi:MAG: HAD family phosphatase [Verrucomicrobia bacterium]|nr:HAD family phosphatase [Verrucomicrobiota bacterium]